MKNKISILAFFVAMLASCAGIAQKNDKSDTLSTSVSEKSTIKADNNQVEITEGKGTVIEIQVKSGGDPRVDAQITNGLIFEIPMGKDTFKIDNWEKTTAFMEISGCRCMDLGYNPIISGYIKGEKTKDNSWKIEANIVAKGKDSGEDRPFEFSGNVPVQ